MLPQLQKGNNGLHHISTSRGQWLLKLGLGKTQHSWAPSFSSPSLIVHNSRTPQSPFVCGELDPRQLEEPRLALSSKLTGRGTSTDESGPEKIEGLGGKITFHQNAPVLWKIRITLNDHSGTQRDFHYSLCLETKIFLFSLMLSLLKITWNETCFERIASVNNLHPLLRRT